MPPVEPAAIRARPVLGALAVVIHDDRVLLACRRNKPDAGLWGYPGGHVEGGETALAAAARELLEETAIRAEPVAYLTNIDILHETSGAPLAQQYLLAAVLCRYVSGAPCPADDVSEARWVPVADIRAGALPMSLHVDDVMELALTRQALRP